MSKNTASRTQFFRYKPPKSIIGRRLAAALLPRLFRKNLRSHHKGATGRVRTGDQRLPVLCHGQLGQDILRKNALFLRKVEGEILRRWLNILRNYVHSRTFFTQGLRRSIPLLPPAPPPPPPPGPPTDPARHLTRSPNGPPSHPARHPTLPATPPGPPPPCASQHAACLPSQISLPASSARTASRALRRASAVLILLQRVCGVQVNVQSRPIFYTPHLIFYVPHLKFYTHPPKFFVPHLIFYYPSNIIRESYLRCSGHPIGMALADGRRELWSRTPLPCEVLEGT